MFGFLLNVSCCDPVEQVAGCWVLELVWLVQEVFGYEKLGNYFAIVCEEKDVVFDCFSAAFDQEFSNRNFLFLSRLN